MRVKPLHDWAVIRPSEAKEKSTGGIIIPDAAREKPQEGEVIAIGEGRFTDSSEKGKKKEKNFVKTTLKAGDKVVYEKYGGRNIDIGDEELVLVREEDILGLLK